MSGGGPASAIVAHEVEKTYGRGARAVHALRSVTLAVEPGEVFGLLGPNGAGKTTLVKVLLDLVRPTGGSASVLGVPARSRLARREVGYLPEDHRFPEYHTPESALAFFGGLSGVPRAEIRARASRLLGQVGLAGAARRKVRGFSKGMKQRLGLAAALVSDPNVLLLDEPTDGVDPVGRAEIRAILEEESRRGRTIFVNSHLLSEVEQLCGRVAILREGTVVRSGTLAELTRVERAFAIATAEPPPAEVLAEISRIARSVRAGVRGIEVALASDDQLDLVIDLLRARGVRIRGLASARRSLEEVFLESVRDPGAGR